MSETAQLMYGFVFFPLALFFLLYSFVSFGLFAPSPRYAVILKTHAAMLLSNMAQTPHKRRVGK